jgi:hypothetical protein
MSPSPKVAHMLFLVCAVSVATLLLIAGGMINDIAAIAVAGGAQPLFGIVKQSAAKQEKRLTLTNLADALISPLDHQGTLQSVPSKQDRRTSRRSA